VYDQETEKSALCPKVGARGRKKISKLEEAVMNFRFAVPYIFTQLVS
jgi:hypothetical protein